MLCANQTDFCASRVPKANHIISFYWGWTFKIGFDFLVMKGSNFFRICNCFLLLTYLLHNIFLFEIFDWSEYIVSLVRGKVANQNTHKYSAILFRLLSRPNMKYEELTISVRKTVWETF